MSGGRYPGPIGTRTETGCITSSGPLDYSSLSEADEKLNQHRMLLIVEEKFKTDIMLLVKIYGRIKNKQGDKSYTYRDKKKNRQYRVHDYIKDCKTFFGSADSYRAYIKKAHDALEETNKKLRRMIEPPKAQRKTSWEYAQDIFYAWVIKAYENKLGDKVNISKLINAQMSVALTTALKQVKLDYGKDFQHGGFNPRPMKLQGYRLGTLSDHAVGTAVDIESNKNAHIQTKIWDNILTFTGISLSHTMRKTQWKNKPKDLYDAVNAVNDAFVKKLKKSQEDTVAAAKKLADAKDATPEQKKAYERIKKDPLKAAIENNAALGSIDKAFLQRWKNGFFTLSWSLIKELHEEDFLWGATFSHPDLHHFEL